MVTQYSNDMKGNCVKMIVLYLHVVWMRELYSTVLVLHPAYEYDLSHNTAFALYSSYMLHIQ